MRNKNEGVAATAQRKEKERKMHANGKRSRRYNNKRDTHERSRDKGGTRTFDKFAIDSVVSYEIMRVGCRRKSKFDLDCAKTGYVRPD